MSSQTIKDASRLTVQVFTSSEQAAMSNSYLISGVSDAILFDVVMLRSEATKLSDMVAASEKSLRTIFISHAHPDHFAGLDVLTERFPSAQVACTATVADDIRVNGQWIIPFLQGKRDPEAPQRLILPDVLNSNVLTVDEVPLEVVEFGEGESEHTT